MSEHTNIRLEKKDGTVIAYFAPNFEVTPQDKNDVLHTSRPARLAIARDRGRWVSEIVVQGKFQHSSELPPQHQQDLEDLFGKSPVTPQDQVNRLRAHTVYSDNPGSLNFFHIDNEYTASSLQEADIQAGVYPEVAVMEIRNPEQAGTPQKSYMIRLAIGQGD